MKFTQKFCSNRRFFLIAAASFTASTVFACGSPQETATNSGTAPSAANVATTGVKESIKVGVSPVPAGDILKFVKNNLAPQAGLDIQIVEFNDGVQPNIALKEEQIDANYFQHVPYRTHLGSIRVLAF